MAQPRLPPHAAWMITGICQGELPLQRFDCSACGVILRRRAPFQASSLRVHPRVTMITVRPPFSVSPGARTGVQLASSRLLFPPIRQALTDGA